MKLFIFLSVLFVHLGKVYLAPSFDNHHGVIEGGSQIIEGGPEIIEEGPEIIEGGPQITQGGSESVDSSRWTVDEHQIELSPTDRITKDPLGRNFKIQKSRFSSIVKAVKFVTLYKQKSVKRWSRICDVAKKVSGESEDFTHVKEVIDTVLHLEKHGSPPPPEIIWKKLIKPTYDALQDDSLSEMERMWTVGVLSYGKSRIPEDTFKEMLPDSELGFPDIRGRGDLDLFLLKGQAFIIL